MYFVYALYNSKEDKIYVGQTRNLEKRLFEKVRLNKHSLQLFKNFVGKTRIIRSVELMALAFEKNYFQKEFSRTRDALEAALYAMKFAGCAVSDHEIEQYLKGALR